jgi:hypothetical protein
MTMSVTACNLVVLSQKDRTTKAYCRVSMFMWEMPSVAGWPNRKIDIEGRWNSFHAFARAASRFREVASKNRLTFNTQHYINFTVVDVGDTRDME